MATHFLAEGGQRVHNVASIVRKMFPSTPMLPNEAFAPDARRVASRHTLQRCFDLSCGSLGCNCNTAQCKGSRALRDYIQDHTIANGDSVVLVYIPKDTSLDRIYWAVEAPLTSGVANIRYVPGTGPAIVIATGVPLTAVNSALIDVWAVNGGPLLAQTNGHVEIVVSGLPAPAAGAVCGCVSAGGINGLNFTLTATVERYRTGCP